MDDFLKSLKRIQLAQQNEAKFDERPSKPARWLKHLPTLLHLSEEGRLEIGRNVPKIMPFHLSRDFYRENDSRAFPPGFSAPSQRNKGKSLSSKLLF